MHAQTELHQNELYATCPHCGRENLVDWLFMPVATDESWCCESCDTDFDYVSPARTIADDFCATPGPRTTVLQRRLLDEEAALDWKERLSACHQPDVYGEAG